uniref:L1 transposable element RRM domain-containing protein n=2 Tax=Micrurus TaxID=8634 RepID=A0A2D4KJC8_9SAUR
MKNIQQMMVKNEERFQKNRRKRRSNRIDNRLIAIKQDKGKEMITWEMDRADFYLRFQNIEEEKRENFEEIIIKVLAGVLEISKEKMMDGIDEVFQVYTRYAMRHKLPREVHVRFTKKAIKKEIL